MFVAIGIQREMRMRPIVMLPPLRLYNIFPHYLKRQDFGKNCWTQNVCFDFVYSFCLKRFSF